MVDDDEEMLPVGRCRRCEQCSGSQVSAARPGWHFQQRDKCSSIRAAATAACGGDSGVDDDERGIVQSEI